MLTIIERGRLIGVEPILLVALRLMGHSPTGVVRRWYNRHAHVSGMSSQISSSSSISDGGADSGFGGSSSSGGGNSLDSGVDEKQDAGSLVLGTSIETRGGPTLSYHLLHLSTEGSQDAIISAGEAHIRHTYT
jgi:hypothetical protein